jgi:hypothetical protein
MTNLVRRSARPGGRRWRWDALGRRRASVSEIRRIAGVDEATRRLLLGFVVPLWVGAGLADWLCHRRSDIEHTAGTREAAIHAAMMAQAGVPAMLGLFFEVNAGVLATTVGALATHQATAAWDVAYAESRREVTATEQHVHGLLEQGPVMATAFLLALHWDQALALIGAGDTRARWRLRRKRPLNRRYTTALLGAIGAFVAAPYGEELLRCWRVARSGEAEAD